MKIQITAALVFFAALAAAPAESAAQTAPYQVSWWNWHGTGPFWNVDSELAITAESTTTGYYYSHYWDFQHETTAGGYMGLQSHATRPDGTVGKMAIFSIWDATSASGPHCQDFGGEGIGKSCHIAYEWVAGHTYRLRTWILSGTTWGAWVLDENTNVETYIGQITAPAGSGYITGSSNFTEAFSAISSCGQLPYTRAVYFNQTANNRAVQASAPSTYLDHGSCTNYHNDYTPTHLYVSHAIGERPCGGLGVNGALVVGERVSSCDGRFSLAMQGDGNLVEYWAGHGALWSTVTYGTPAEYVIMQGDGNLVLYGGSTPYWYSHTAGYNGGTLSVQSDGNLVVYQGGVARWNAGTCCH